MLGRQIRGLLQERPDLIALGSRRVSHSSTLAGASSNSAPVAARDRPGPLGSGSQLSGPAYLVRGCKPCRLVSVPPLRADVENSR
jgi:hypothetical protein